MRAEALKGHLDGLILAMLQGGPAHGYVIAQALRARSEGAERAAAGVVGSELLGVLGGDLARRAKARQREAGRRALLAGDVVGKLGQQPLARRGPDAAQLQLGLELAQPAHASTASIALTSTRHSWRRSSSVFSPERVSR